MRLALSAETKAKIVQLGVPNAAALLATIRAVPEDFASYLDSSSVEKLKTMLESRLSESERAVLDAPTPRYNATGAIIGKNAPILQPPRYDLATRDRLFEQLQRLRQQANPSPETKRRTAELEQNVNTLLEKA